MPIFIPGPQVTVRDVVLLSCSNSWLPVTGRRSLFNTVD